MNDKNRLLAGTKQVIVIGGDILASRKYSNSGAERFGFCVADIKENSFTELLLLFDSERVILK